MQLARRVHPQFCADSALRITHRVRAARHCVIALFVSYLPCNAAIAGINWYTNEVAKCDGSQSLDDAFRDKGWLTYHVDLVANTPAAGKFHVRLSVADIQDVSAAKGMLTLDSEVLDAQSAQLARNLMLKEERPIPWYLPVINDFILGFVTDAATTEITETLFEWLKVKKQLPELTMSEASNLIADGGALQEVLAVYQEPDKQRRAIYATSYSVQLGRETRTILLFTCRYAVETTVSAFLTRGTLNNKQVIPVGDRWRVKDLDTNQYDSSILIYQGQDEEYYYFGVENEPGEQQRMSFQHGPWQLFNNGRWKTLYAEIDAQ